MKYFYILMFILLTACGGGGGDSAGEQPNVPNNETPIVPVNTSLNWDNTNWNSNWN